MSRLMIGALTIASVLACGAGEAAAQRGGGGFGPRGGWMRHVKALDLSPEQVQKIAQARADMIAKVAPIKAQIQAKRQELRMLWAAKSPNRRSIIAKHDEIDALQRQVRDARIDLKLRVVGVLTPAQRAQLQKSIEAGPPWRGRPMGKRPGPGRGGPRRGGLGGW